MRQRGPGGGNDQRTNTGRQRSITSRTAGVLAAFLPLGFGPGKQTDDVVLDCNQTDRSVSWPVRLNEEGTFEVMINYDAPTGTKAKVAEGDAGKEVQRAQKSAAGIYNISVGGKEFVKPVRQGNAVKEKLGSITLEPGDYEIRVSAQEITGEELFRLRNITLPPVKP